MKLYEAIAEMRRISKNGGSFSFTFMSCDTGRRQSEGPVYVRSARLLKRESTKYNSHAEDMERYINLDTMEARRFWQPLLMFFNGNKIEI